MIAMVFLGAFLVMIGIALIIIALPFIFNHEFRNAVYSVVIGCVFLIGGFYVVDHYKPKPEHCIVSQNSTILWRSFSGNRGAAHQVYFAAPNNTFCLVEDMRLYNMGLGYRTTKTYQGIIIYRP